MANKIKTSHNNIGNETEMNINDFYINVNTHQEMELKEPENTQVKEIVEKICKIHEKNLTINERRNINEIFMENQNVFSKNEIDCGQYLNPDGVREPVKIHVENEKDCVYITPKRIQIQYRSWLENHLEELESAGIIQEVKGNDIDRKGPIWQSRLVIVKKQSGKLRLCIDLRAVNKKVLQTSYPLPNLKDCIEKHEGGKIFSSMDLRSGFFSVELDPDSKRFTGFAALGKTWVFSRLPMGLRSSPSIFCQKMSQTLSPLMKSMNLSLYLDDLALSSNTIEQHTRDLNTILVTLKKAGLKINHNKSDFFTKNIIYLGHKIGLMNDGKYGLAPKDDKIKALLLAPEPLTTKACRGFCSGISFYATFYERNSKAEYKFTEKMRESFKNTKELLAKEALLTLPNPSYNKTLKTDASDIGCAGVLSQFNPVTNKEEIIGFFSKTFDKVQEKWSAIEKEAVGVLWSLEFFDVYIKGTPFTLVSDNKTLCKMILDAPKTDTRTGRKLNRYIEFINEYDMSVKHMPGTSRIMALPDFLSRSPVPNNTIGSIYKNEKEGMFSHKLIENTESKFNKYNNEEIEHNHKTTSNCNQCSNKDTLTQNKSTTTSSLHVNISGVTLEEWSKGVERDIDLLKKNGIWFKYRNRLQ